MEPQAESFEHFAKLLGNTQAAEKVCVMLRHKTVTVGQLTRTVLGHLMPQEIVKVFSPLISSDSETETICDLARSLANNNLMHGLVKLAPPRAQREIAALLAREYGHVEKAPAKSTPASGATPPPYLQQPTTPAPQSAPLPPRLFPPHGAAPISPPAPIKVPAPASGPKKISSAPRRP